MSKGMEAKIANIAEELERMPERMEEVKETLEGWKGEIAKTVKKNPVRTVVGAFVIGYVVAKVGRYL